MRDGTGMLWETILLAQREIRRNVLRSSLTILGIVIGVAAVIAMVTLGQGATAKVTSDIATATKESQIHILCLPTPLNNEKIPDLSMVVAATEALGKDLKKGDLVILESTVYPGVTSQIIKPKLETLSGLTAGKDFGLAYCFERVDPGNIEHRIDNSSKIISAIDEASEKATRAIYEMVVNAPIFEVSNFETAELVKLVENVYRDINIAFSNEISLLCDKLGIDILEVLRAASTKWSFHPHIPGAGVGGMCIPVNPYYLTYCAREMGLELKLVQCARELNESMPHRTVELVKKAFARIDKPINRSKVCILGIAYKADCKDTRGAPGITIAHELSQLGARVICHDPVVDNAPEGISLEASFEEAIKSADCLVIATDHSAFKLFNLQMIATITNMPAAIVDGRHVVKAREAEALGIAYFGIGRTSDNDLHKWNYNQI